jgi:hypothetical protein
MPTKEKRDFPPNGPYAPPTPTEAAEADGEPMAVARDKTTTDDAFRPTTAPEDARTRRSGKEGDEEAERHPPGFVRSEEPGFLEMDAEEKE